MTYTIPSKRSDIVNASHAPDAARLATQSLGRPLDEQEKALARSMEALFATGQHDFEAVAQWLESQRVVRPSGQTGVWTVETLEWELARINTSLDAAYVNRESGAPIIQEVRS